MIMEQTTEIATRTRLNADFVPGMVTVLKGAKLEARGVHTVREALSLVPGIIPSVDKDIVVRGVARFASGKVKLLLNGVPVNETLTAQGSFLYYLPVEMIERIEVIRGPGAALYGEYAYTGVVNIITRQQGKRLFARYGTFDTYAGGGHYSYAPPEKNWSMSLNLAGYVTHGDNILSGPDILHSAAYNPTGVDNAAISLAPGFTNEEASQQSAIFSWNYKDFSLLAQHVRSGRGIPYNVTVALPPADSGLVMDEKEQMIEARLGFDLMPTLGGEIKLGWQQYIFDMDDHTYYPPGYTQILTTPPYAIPFADGMSVSAYGKEQKFYGGLTFDYTGFDRHHWTLGLESAFVDFTDSASSFNGEAYSWDENWSTSEVNRQIIGVMVQDQLEITDHLTLTAGLRYDHYDDVGESLTPRVALTWRINDHHILKAQYGEAFRPPTFMEMYSVSQQIGDENIQPETIHTFELGYIHRQPGLVGRVTLFHSKLKDLIDLVENQYQNREDVEVDGIELELEKELFGGLKLDGNLSYATTEDSATGQELEGAANWLANAGLVYQPVTDYALYLQYHYVGRRHREVGDDRDKLGAFGTLDLTGHIHNLWHPGLTLRLGVKNLFDADVTHPAPAETYPEDFPREGQEFWLGLTMVF
ncbi:MAG: TonB-dependent receptor [Magnetococcales bacterium]|nr:TonB-dependent receptor [Magnetococcales bacterium]